MKIYIVGTRWHGNVEFYYSKAFKDLGHEVKTFYYNKSGNSIYERIFAYRDANIPVFSKKLSKVYNGKINEQLIKEVNKINPDIVLIFNGLQIYSETIRKIKRTVDKVINWIGDDPFRFFQLGLNLKYFDEIFVTEPSIINPLELLIEKKVHYLPNASDPDYFFPLDEDKVDSKFKSEIAFIGHSYNSDTNGLLRGKILDALSNYNLKIYGDNGWYEILKKFPALKGCFVDMITKPKETNMIYNGAKIVMNIHHTQNRLSTSQRTFEIASAGGFQLAESKQEIRRFFPNSEIVCFDSLSHLKKLVNYYLKNDYERKAKLDAARDIVLKNHTYKERVQSMLTIIKNI